MHFQNKFNLKNEINEYLSKKIILTIGGVGDINILNIIENIFSINIDKNPNEIFEIVKNERENSKTERADLRTKLLSIEH